MSSCAKNALVSVLKVIPKIENTITGLIKSLVTFENFKPNVSDAKSILNISHCLKKNVEEALVKDSVDLIIAVISIILLTFIVSLILIALLSYRRDETTNYAIVFVIVFYVVMLYYIYDFVIRTRKSIRDSVDTCLISASNNIDIVKKQTDQAINAALCAYT